VAQGFKAAVLKTAAPRRIICARMQAGAAPGRTVLAALLCAALLAAVLTPCPPRAGAEHGDLAAAADHPPGCEMHETTASVSPGCPCGCGERAPLAGSSARLGVALPSTAPGFELVLVPAQAPATAPLAQDCFVPDIDHVPLPA
jgi:hypothetical protein